jgi:hypothetical protein
MRVEVVVQLTLLGQPNYLALAQAVAAVQHL